MILKGKLACALGKGSVRQSIPETPVAEMLGGGVWRQEAGKREADLPAVRQTSDMLQHMMYRQTHASAHIMGGKVRYYIEVVPVSIWLYQKTHTAPHCSLSLTL